MVSELSRTPSPPVDLRHRNSPPPSPPSPNPAETETMLGKREREVSVEPAMTPKATIDSEAVALRESRTPAKKNRILDPTAEEDDNNESRSRSNSISPPLGVSPPHEMKIKVRQISQGVEDLSWRNLKPPPDEPPKDEKPAAQKSASSDEPVPEEPVVNHEPALKPTEASADEKGLKRTYLQRGTSEGPAEAGKPQFEPLKRPRDDADKDDNPRETKRPSPPPEAPKLGGFMAYASASSPFASVKGQNIFSSRRAASPAPSTPLSEVSTTAQPALTPKSSFSSTTSATPSKPPKRSGFEAFASTSSPFASAARAKSPVLGGSTPKFGRSKSPSASTSIAFSAYTGRGMQGFGLPPSKKARAGSPSVFDKSLTDNTDSGAEEDEERQKSFGEKLRAAKEDEEAITDGDHSRLHLTEQEVATGEEEEETITQVRGKLFSLADGASWKERGTGLLKLNVRASDGGGARLVMRKEAVYTLLLNVTLFRGMSCMLAQDPRYLRFSVIENGVTTHYNLKVANAKIAHELMEEIQNNLP